MFALRKLAAIAGLLPLTLAVMTPGLHAGSISPGLPHDPLPAVLVPSKEQWTQEATSRGLQLCYLEPSTDGGDDAPTLIKAFNDECRSKSIIVLAGPVYNINSTMRTTDLDRVEIHQYGRVLWTPDIDYWLSVSMPVGFQNQSTVWQFGGKKVLWEGHGTGTMDGNGQVWYNWAHGRGNLPHRPMNINFDGLKDSVLRGLRFVQPQMWTMNIMHSQNLVLEDIYVNATSRTEHNTLNTDGADVMYSDNITFRRWSVTNGDDAIALKANSSNVHLYDSEFWHSTGIAIGSMGQYKGEHEHIENFYVKNVTMHSVIRGCYFKSWTGVQMGYPPNGGGGGLGYARNVVLEDIVLDHTRSEPLFIHQCENYSGHNGENCFTSLFEIGDITWRNWTGWTGSSKHRAGFFKCSAAAGGCGNLTVEDWHVKDGKDSDKPLDSWHCDFINDHKGFKCDWAEQGARDEDPSQGEL